jgi:glycosyltransferase involved in cell wall biosynthesis
LSVDLSGRPDEGVKKTTLALAGSMARRYDVAVVSTEGDPATSPGRVVASPRTFLSPALRAALSAYRPDVILYVARSSTTFAAFLRARVLRAYCPRARVALVGLQARTLGRSGRRLVRFLRPDLILVQSRASRVLLAGAGRRVELLPSGVDLARFRPVEAERREQLRRRYGLAGPSPVVLHVGHLQAGRGIPALAELASRGRCRVALVASSSTEHESDLADRLRGSGVVVIADYLPHVEQVYQLADAYVFPVESTDHAIEVPLSVLEALACDLPVVSTRFAGLVDLFEATIHPGFRFVGSSAELIEEAERMAGSGTRGTRSLAEPYGWDRVVDDVLGPILTGAVGGDT